MSSTIPRLSAQTLSLLMKAMESRRPLLSAAALQRFPAEAAQLKAESLIRPAGHEPIATVMDDHCDTPVSLQWSADEGKYGYFSEARGWVSTRDEDVQSFSIDVPKFTSALTRKLQVIPSNPTIAFVADHVWDLGRGRLGRKPHRIPVMFGRRLHDRKNWQAFKEALRENPSPHRRLLLTTTSNDRLPDAASLKCIVVSVGQMLVRSGTLELDPAAVASRMDDLPPPDLNGPLWINADGREVHFYGTRFTFATGLKQRDVILTLYKHYLQDELLVSSAKIIDELDWNPKTRLRDIFKGNVAWDRLLSERSGMCGFCFPLNNK